MRPYQAVFIIKPNLAEDKTAAIIEKVKEVITAGGGQLGAVNPWGRKALATAFDRLKEGYYVVVEFEGEGTTVESLQHAFRVNEDIVRFIVAAVPPGGYTTPVPEPAERKGGSRFRQPRSEKA